MIEAVGHATQSLGGGRALGQIFAYLYFSRNPRSLDDMTAALGISKGSASTGVRQLEKWGALEKLRVKGDRKDYYKANDAFGKIISNAALDLAGKRMKSSAELIRRAEAELRNTPKNPGGISQENKFVMERLEKIRIFQKKAEGMWQSVILEMLLR